MAKPQGDVESKLIHLPPPVIRKLTLMAVDTEQKNFKKFAEHILTEKSKEADKKSKK